MVINRYFVKPVWASAATLLLLNLPTASAQEVVGVTLAARGVVEATDLVDLDVRPLARRADVFDVDAIITGADSQAQIRMRDDAVLSLRPNSELVIAEYAFNEDSGEGRAVLELVSGGLRTLTGRISSELGDDNYELQTSVGSIGIRGTHFEVMESSDSLFFAVWDGEIEIALDVGRQSDPVTLGTNSDFSFAEIGRDGRVEFFLESPMEFSEGHTEDDIGDDTDEPNGSADSDMADLGSDSSAPAPSNQEPSEPNESAGLALPDGMSPTLDPIDVTPINIPTPPNVVADRTGTVTYGDLLAVDLDSGIEYDVSLSYQVNFSAGTIDEGKLKLTSTGDTNSEWLAGFSGGITGNELQLGNPLGTNASFNDATHFRDHAGYEAEGTMTGQFFGADAEQVRGAFSLQEVVESERGVSGNYQLGRTAQ